MVQSTQKDGSLVFQFLGRLDTAECVRIEGDVMQKAQAAGQPVVFDLADVDFVASAFLRLCLMAEQKVAGNRLALVNVSPPIKKVFKIAGLDKLVAG
jgi:anti-anti-sigma factor